MLLPNNLELNGDGIEASLKIVRSTIDVLVEPTRVLSPWPSFLGL